MNRNRLNATEAAVTAAVDASELVRGSEQELIEQVTPLVRRQSVSLDLKNVQRIDAAGIAALITLYGSARDAGHRFCVANPSAHVAEILALVGLDHILVSQNTVESSHSGACLERSAA